jgi:hypothetical protein
MSNPDFQPQCICGLLQVFFENEMTRAVAENQGNGAQRSDDF